MTKEKDYRQSFKIANQLNLPIWLRIAFAVECANTTSMTTLICRIPEKLDARLEKLARQAKVPKSKFVRKALEQAARKTRANGTAFSLVSARCGSLSGPSDLATNPKHLCRCHSPTPVWSD